MKTVRAVGLLFALGLAVPAGAAIQYEFRQVTHSDVASVPGGDVLGKAVIDGNRSRVDYTTKSVYGNASTAIALEGGRYVYILDRDKKTYAELDVAKVAMAVGTKPIQIRNIRTDVQKLDDRPVIAGHPTEHYRLLANYEMTIAIGGIPLTQSVSTVIDKWVTSSFGEVSEQYLSGGVPLTGNAELDQVLTAESTKIKGFPLRQVTTITTTRDQRRVSEIKIQPTRRQTSEMIVTSIRQVTASPSQFEIPAGFTRASAAAPAEKPDGVKMLSLEPVSGN